MIYDICIIGAGVSGMAAAITASNGKNSILLIDKNNKPGKKMYATGNGKCNISNEKTDYFSHYNSAFEDYAEFMEKSIGSAPCKAVIEFMSSIGVLTENKNGYIYPASRQASAVVWAMTDAIRQLKVELKLETEVKDVRKEDKFYIDTDKGTYYARKVIIACGGKSYSKLGGSESGYVLAKNLGHRIVPLRPALCGMFTRENTKSIAGVRTICRADISIEDKNISENGEVQFTEYGISGIVIFNLSSKAGKLIEKNREAEIRLDVLPDISEAVFEKLVNLSQARSIQGMLNGLINDKLALYLIERLGHNPKKQVSSISANELHKIYCCMKKMCFTVYRLKDYESAQVTSGGVSLSEINPGTFMSKLVKDLYIVGEVTDIDGICGGYNISYSILSGVKAGKMCNDKN